MLSRISIIALLQILMVKYSLNYLPSMTIMKVLTSFIESVSDNLTKVKVGLEATEHYSYNFPRFLLAKGLTTFVINSLHTKSDLPTKKQVNRASRYLKIFPINISFFKCLQKHSIATHSKNFIF